MKKRAFYWGQRLDETQLGIAVNTPKPCSCYMCGSVRKYYNEKSMQELRFEQVCKEQLS